MYYKSYIFIFNEDNPTTHLLRIPLWFSRCFSGPFAQKVRFMDWLCNSNQGRVGGREWVDFPWNSWRIFLNKYFFEVYAAGGLQARTLIHSGNIHDHYFFLGGKGPNLHHPLWTSVWAGPNVFILIFLFIFCEFWKLAITVRHFDVECYLLILLQLILWNLR